MKKIGIYKITNIKNGKVYVGSSANLDKRYYYHLNYLRNNKHSNIHLQRSYNIDGEDSFKFSVIEECTIDILIEREEFYMVYLNTLNTKYGYNINPKGDRPPSWLGKKHTEETKLKISIKNKGKTQSQYSKDIASLTHKGKKLSDKQINDLKIRNSGEGNPMFGKTPYDIWVEKYGKEEADERKLNMIKNLSEKNSGEGNPMFGKTPYDIWVEKYGKEEADIRYKSWRSKTMPEESKERLRKLNIGKKASDKTKKLQSEKRKGELNPSCKIKNEEVIKILEMINNGISVPKIAKQYGVTKTTIYNIKKGKRKI